MYRSAESAYSVLSIAEMRLIKAAIPIIRKIDGRSDAEREHRPSRAPTPPVFRKPPESSFIFPLLKLAGS